MENSQNTNIVSSKPEEKDKITASESSNIPKDLDITKLSSKDMIAKAVENIKIEYEGDILKLDSILEIFRALTIISIPDFTRNVQKERKDRRDNFDNMIKYLQIWAQSAGEFEKLLAKSQNDVLAALKIDSKLWEKSSIYQMDLNYEQMFNASISIPISLKASLLPSKKLTIDQLKVALELQIKYYTEFDAKELNKLMPDPNESVNIVQNRVNDLVHKLTGLEEEDIISAAKEHSYDLDVQRLLSEIQDSTMKFAEQKK